MAVFAVQVTGGREARAAELIERFAGEELIGCYVPSYEHMRRVGGQWRRVTSTLFPGYLFIETRSPAQVQADLRATPTFTRLLGSHDDKFIPLAPDEVTWLEALTTAKTHVVAMSEGIIEGDRVIVTSGALKGHEALITKVDRHKRLAYLDMRMFGRTKTIPVGLEIVSKRENVR